MFRLNRSFFISVILLMALFSRAWQPMLQPQAVRSAPTPTPRPARPAFLHTGCLYPITPEDRVECGFLLVPEVRSQPDSRTIRLHVLRFKSFSESPAPDPLILLNGGPGSPGAPLVSGILGDLVGEVWRAERDVLYLDQRGRGFSLPSLHCPGPTSDPDEALNLTYAEQLAVDTEELRACYQNLQQQGINFAAYNLLESAADINDLRQVLGYEQVNLYGFSYGSLLAQTVMRIYPTTVQSVILDAVLPPGVDLRSEKATSVQHGLDALFAACAVDTACDRAYPDLATVFNAVTERLRRVPVPVVVALADDDVSVLMGDLKFVDHVVYHLQTNAAYTLPADIYAAYAGDYTAPAWSWLARIDARQMSVRRGENEAMGLYYSTMCSYLNSYPPAVYHQTLNPSLNEYSQNAFAGCAVWPVPALAISVTELVKSDIPTLLLTGRFDSALPAYLNQSMLAMLRHSYAYELATDHTAVASQCGLGLTVTFLRTPLTAPDGSCVADMQVGWVLPEQ